MLKQLDTLIGLSVVMLVVSLFITIITQIFSSLLGLRGKNLADALEAMAHQIDPDIDKNVKGLAKELADQVLTHPAVSDSMLSMRRDWPIAWKRASAIRPDELLDVLKLIGGNTSVAVDSPPPNTVGEAAARLLKGLGKPRGANDFDSAAITSAIEEMRKQLPSLAVQKGADVIKEFEAATNVALGNVEKWFNSTQDRAKQWFAMHARVLTVIASVIAAFGLQLDFLKLFDRISSDAEFRARLVASTPTLLKQTQDVFDAADNTNDVSICTNVFADLNKRHFGNTNILVLPANSSLLSDVDILISNQLATAGYSNQIASVVSEYNDEAGKLSRKKVDELVQKFGSINDQFSKTGVELIADPYPAGWEWIWPFSHLLGLLLSVALLSLGAPFWFNTLKSLTNLRPLLAQQVDKQSKSTSNLTDTKT
jgi:hypothetical protein